jgi:hypothetical protein
MVTRARKNGHVGKAALKPLATANRRTVNCGVKLMHPDKERTYGIATYLGSEDGGSSTHKRGSISRRRSEESGREEASERYNLVVCNGWSRWRAEVCESRRKLSQGGRRAQLILARHGHDGTKELIAKFCLSAIAIGQRASLYTTQSSLDVHATSSRPTTTRPRTHTGHARCMHASFQPCEG